MLFTPFSTNPFPYLQETYKILNRLPNLAQLASHKPQLQYYTPSLSYPPSQGMPPCHGLSGGLHTYASSKED
jgi:hypothetical protein